VKEGDWNEYNVDQLDNSVGNRVAFAQALTDGISVFDLKDSEAKAEIEQVIKEMERAKWV
jgi:chromosome partitioning protein